MGPKCYIFEGPHNLLRAQIFSLIGLSNGITIASKSVGPAGPPSDNFEGLHSFLRAIGPRACLILTPTCTGVLLVDGLILSPHMATCYIGAQTYIKFLCRNEDWINTATVASNYSTTSR